MDDAAGYLSSQCPALCGNCSVTIQWLPEVVVEKIFGYLTLEDVSRAAEVCQLFRRAASTLLRSAMRRLVPQIERQMSELERETMTLEDDSTQQQLHIALLHSVLRVILAETRMLKAICWRYVRNTSFLEFCFPAGEILDDLFHVLHLVQDREINKDIEPEVTTGIFLRIEKFLDSFDVTIEPFFSNCNLTLSGLKIIDILDCCQSSNYNITITHGANDDPFFLSAFYELRDVSTIDNPPNLSDDMTTDMKLKTICRYLRNNVRWNNLFHPLKELWDLEDAVEDGGRNPFSGTLVHHHNFHRRMMEKVSPTVIGRSFRETMQTHQRNQINSDIGLYRDNFKRELEHFNSRLGLTCEIQLHGRSKSQLPLDLEFLKEMKITHSNVRERESNDSNISNESSSKTISVSETATSEKKQKESSSIPQVSSCVKVDAPKTKKLCGVDWVDGNDIIELGGGFSFKLNLKVLYPSTTCLQFFKETTITVEQNEVNARVSSSTEEVPK